MNGKDGQGNSDMASTEVPEKIVFSKEEVEALLNEKLKMRQFDLKVSPTWKLCISGFCI